jgi:hypothetical protein
MESTIEEERLTMEEELSRLEAIFEHQELSKELKKKPYRKVSLPQQKDTRKKASTCYCCPWQNVPDDCIKHWIRREK